MDTEPEMKPKGLVLGFYHQRNAGDDRLASCLERWLVGHDLTFLSHNELLPINFVNRFDYVILGGGSILNGHHGALTQVLTWQARLAMPIFIIGATICSLNTRMLEAIRQIADTGQRVWLRDQRSADILQARAQVTVAPDLSWLFPLNWDCPHQRVLPAIVNLRPWKNIADHTANLHQNLGNAFTTVYPWVLCEDPSSSDVPLSREVANTETCSGYDTSLVARAEFAVAMRYHAIIFAIQSGTPFLAIQNTRKVQCLLEELELEWAQILPDTDGPQFKDKATKARQQLTPDRLRRITETQHEQVSTAADAFRARLNQAAQARRQRQQTLTARLKRRIGTILSPS